MTAIQMGTINSAEAYRIDHLVGSISPGRIADILLVDSPEEFHVEAVIANGRPAARDGRLAFELKAPERSSVLKSVLKCKKTTKADFAYKTSIQNGTADVLSMDVQGPFVRKRRDVVLKVENGIVLPRSRTGCGSRLRPGKVWTKRQPFPRFLFRLEPEKGSHGFLRRTG